jgi:lipid IVA palmitoyltransferase
MSPLLVSALFRARRARNCAGAIVAFAFAVTGASSRAIDLGGVFRSKLETINLAVHSGEWESYVTGYAWHLPWAYVDSTRARLNETTWGGGFGRTVTDADGDRHSVFVLALEDSHRAAQFTAGYGWHRYWPATPHLSLGLGYMAFLFSREDVAHHLPIPAALPCASIRYRRCEFVGMFIPRISEDVKGNVIFVFMRVPLGGAPARMKRQGL